MGKKEKKEYDAFVDDPATIQDGIVDLAIRELTPDNRREKYFTRYVRAQISRDSDAIPDGDLLRLRYQRGRLSDNKWGIKIQKELGDFMPKEVGRIKMG
ncbi:MAG: phenylphosphate carboxylase subunit gamma [Syntrophales bacterium]|nr:phenylphosphate carboxylase subunit gamma [Syntrophales bacterium]